MMIFVLVHGINDTSRKLKIMQAAFESQGHRCIVPSLTPKNASKGLDYLARQLSDVIETEMKTDDFPFCLVGFSMGGLIARYYLQELGGYQNVSHFFTLASPHHGSVWAYLSQNIGVKQMRPNSDFLKALDDSVACLANIRCYSYWTPMDLMILPATSSVWANAENISFSVLCHPLMVSDRRIIIDILYKAQH